MVLNPMEINSAQDKIYTYLLRHSPHSGKALCQSKAKNRVGLVWVRHVDSVKVSQGRIGILSLLQKCDDGVIWYIIVSQGAVLSYV